MVVIILCVCARALLAFIKRTRMLLNILQCPGQPPQHRFIQMSTVPRLKNCLRPIRKNLESWGYQAEGHEELVGEGFLEVMIAQLSLERWTLAKPIQVMSQT